MNKDVIVNRVANSGLLNIDLSNYRPKLEILELDLKLFLFNGVILKESLFRGHLKKFDFEKYKDKNVALFCSVDTIIPRWAYMLITTYLSESKVFFGNKSSVFQALFLENINSINSDEFINKSVVVNGCSDIEISESIYIAITKKLQKNVKSLMFGEACSAVPIYKKKK
tara:strand:- start:621 stop:1127 length:507 start_codon:yes stop_codon:yes gene_type:complete